ncbi:MAG: fibronectin type III domain-containing protein [Armatimonadetes bacterium]|nr:fibronectin type III domain-containing protein [Armatimonadota bacterium]
MDEFALTGNAREGRSLSVAFRCSQGSLELFDGRYQPTGQVAHGRVEITFEEPVRVSRVVMIYALGAAEARQAPRRASARVLADGVETGRTGQASLDQPFEFHPLLDAGSNLVWAQEALLPLCPPAAGQDVIVDIVEPSAAVSELLIWGLPERLAERSGQPGAPVSFTVEANTCSSIRVTWDRPAEGTAYIRLRHRQMGEAGWSARCCTADRTAAVVTGLRPSATCEVAVEEVGLKTGKAAKPHRVKLPSPMDVRTAADVFGMNFFPGGGYGYQMHADETTNTLAMLRLMREAGVRHARWWINAPGATELFAEYGIALLPSAENAHQTRHGTWLVHTQNEPDFVNVFPEALARAIRDRRREMNADDPVSLLAAPEVGGDLIGPGSEYVRDLYRAGVKDLFQVMSVHPYVKMSFETPPGGIPCCPEALPDGFRALRKVMREFGDGAKPVIATECIGYGTFEGVEHFKWIPPVSPERQAAWLVRSHLLFLALGVARVYHYTFQDEGTDPTQITHTSGLVDWHGRPKLAYRAYCAMTRLLGPTQCQGPQADARAPVFGARFRRPDGSFLSALWDCGGRSRVALDAGAGVTGVKALLGSPAPVPAANGGRQCLELGEDPLWVASVKPLTLVSQERLAPAIGPQLRVRLDPATVRVPPGGTVQVTALVAHNFAGPMAVAAEVQSPWEPSERFTHTAAVPPGRATRMPVSIACPLNAERRRIHSWGLVCRYGPAGQEPIGVEERHLYIMVPE